MTSIGAEGSTVTAPKVSRRRGWWRKNWISLAFIAPGIIWLLAIVVYPTIATIRFSFFNEAATKFVGLHNYASVFSTDSILTAFKNNIVWVLIFPFFVTFIGLMVAVLTERIRWATAFKAVIVMPIVFSTTASALVWRTVFDLNPHVGVVNAIEQTLSDWFRTPGAYPLNSSIGQTAASLASFNAQGGPNGTVISKSVVHPGGTVMIGMTRISAATLQTLGATTPVSPHKMSGGISGLVWNDFSPLQITNTTTIVSDEHGLPNLRLSLVSSKGLSVASTVTNSSGDFSFSHVARGSYHVEIQSSNFQNAFEGTFWLGSQSITPTNGLNQTAQSLLSVPLIDLAMIISYIWIWAGFAMVLIGAGLASLNREVLEAAEIDGATEWQKLRRVTIPMLAPVLTVVFVTMVINVLKVFDIILNMAPGSSQGPATTLALTIYNDGFTGGIHSGVASAVAVILFLLVVPIMYWNLKKIKG
ncbi:MAG TPA: ABC transporter permease subunit [Acidimicrobiales bacterium]|nr:ABC transporter permease subunit [Acidimicrobiales bacterium]